MRFSLFCRVSLLALAVSAFGISVASARPSDRFSAPQAPPSVAPADTLQSLQRRAEAGEAEAQYRLGIAYQFALGTRRDDRLARQWFAKAAAQDHAHALTSLGYMQSTGSGGAVDAEGAERSLRRAGELGEATAWANLAELILAQRPAEQAQAVALLERAVAAGAMNARYRLGRILIEGELVPADAARGKAMLEEAANSGVSYAQAYLAYLILEERKDTDAARGLALAQRAANAGLAEGANELGRYHLLGFGTRADPKQAATWFTRAGELGEPNGWYNLARMQEDGSLGQADLPEARKLAVRAADAGHLLAAGMAGRMLYRGEGGPRDRAGAYPYLKALADEGVADAQNMLASLLFNGDGRPADQKAAMDWWEKAASQGHGGAVNNFATYLAQGRGRPADPARARRLIAAQAEQGYAPSQFRWALWQEQGWQGTPKDLVAAISWFRRAAENGHGAGAFKYASYLEAGEGIAADPVAARRWYGEGAERGNADAQFQFARVLDAGEGGPADPAAARRWLERAAKQGYPEALFVLGDMAFQNGDAVNAWAYLRLAEEFGIGEAGGNRRYIESRLQPAELDRAAQAAQRLAGAIKREREDE